jgi:hypothetical protein
VLADATEWRTSSSATFLVVFKRIALKTLKKRKGPARDRPSASPYFTNL